MRKKFVKSVLIVACVSGFALGLASCSGKGGEQGGGTEEHTHVLTLVEECAADCLTGGNTEYYVCGGCDKIFSDAAGTNETNSESVLLQPLGHEWDDGTTVPADCTHEGITTRRCKRAGCTVTDVQNTDALGHDVGKEWTQAVNTHYHACSRCGYREDEADHVYTDSDDSVCGVCGNIAYDTAFTFIGLGSNGKAAVSEADIVSYAVSAYSGSRLRVMIPLTYREKPITRIDSETFSGNTRILAVSIPRTVTAIEEEAFFKCTSLIDVELQGGVTEVGYKAFYGCTSLRNIQFSGKISKLGSYSFQQSGLRSVHFPESLTEIGNNVFAECENLTEITIPATVTKAGDTLFTHCTSLENVNFLAQVEVLGNQMFYRCPLKSVKLSSTIKIIEPMCFGYTTLEKVDFLPENLQKIDARAFTGCSKLRQVKIPSAVTFIGVQAFGNCAVLESVTGGGNIRTIEGTAFRDCRELTKIEGTRNIETIGVQAFCNCLKLTSFESGDKLTTIGEKAFYFCSQLTSFNFGSKLTSVGKNAFQCAALDSVRLGSSVTTLGEYAFANNASLRTVEIGSGLQTVGNFVFYACSALTDVSCDSVIGTGMFWGDTALKNVQVGVGVASIGSRAFNGCTGLESVAFEHSGWKAEKTEEDGTVQTVSPSVSADGAANAALLKETYLEYVWTKL